MRKSIKVMQDNSFMTYFEFNKRLAHDMKVNDLFVFDWITPTNEEEYQQALSEFKEISAEIRNSKATPLNKKTLELHNSKNPNNKLSESDLSEYLDWVLHEWKNYKKNENA